MLGRKITYLEREVTTSPFRSRTMRDAAAKRHTSSRGEKRRKKLPGNRR